MPTWKAWKDENNNVFYFDNDHDYQADINAAVAKGDTAAAAKAWDLRRAKGEANGLNLNMGNTNPYGTAGGTYNGTNYSNSIDYGLSADAKFAAGDIEGAREDERKGNAKILGNNMNLELRNKYGSYNETDKSTTAPSYKSDYSDKLDEILNSISV